jgi:hypothetical protein
MSLPGPLIESICALSTPRKGRWSEHFTTSAYFVEADCSMLEVYSAGLPSADLNRTFTIPNPLLVRGAIAVYCTQIFPLGGYSCSSSPHFPLYIVMPKQSQSCAQACSPIAWGYVQQINHLKKFKLGQLWF